MWHIIAKGIRIIRTLHFGAYADHSMTVDTLDQADYLGILVHKRDLVIWFLVQLRVDHTLVGGSFILYVCQSLFQHIEW